VSHFGGGEPINTQTGEPESKGEGLNEKWYTAVLEEYKSLRTEAVTARGAQLSVLRLAVPLLAALIGLGVTLRKDTVVGGLLLGVAVPVIVALTFEMWIGEIQRSVRAGSVVAAIERRLGELFKDVEFGRPMGWEQWLRELAEPVFGKRQPRSQQQRESVFSAMVISVFLFLVAIVSFGLGLHFLWHNDEEPVMYVTAGVIGVGLALLFVRAFFAVKGIENRNVVPKAGELWGHAV
jgi:hypothetical protein